MTVAAGALADAPVRYWFSGAARGAGLRGGSFTAKGYPFVRLRCGASASSGTRAVNGKGSWRFSDGATRGTLAVELPGDDVGARAALVGPALATRAGARRARDADAAGALTLGVALADPGAARAQQS